MSLVPTLAKPGSAEAIIDELADFSGGKKPDGLRADPATATDRLLALYFEAVPSLIDHLDDERLTHHVTSGFNNSPTWHRQVRHVVSELLQDIAGDEMKKDWLTRQHGNTVAKEDALAWWGKAKEAGEEQYLVDHVLPTNPESESPNDLILKRLANKYPKHLPKIYTTVLEDRSHIDTGSLATALVASPIARNVKIQLLVKAGKHSNLIHRRAAFWVLKDFDHERFIDLLVQTLEKLPETPAEPYWRCPEASFACLVGATSEPRAWEALTKVAKQVDVGLRMELIQSACQNEKTKQCQIRFLSSFLDDDSIREEKSNPKMFEGPFAEFHYPRLEVRNHAAMTLAWILKIKSEPNPEWGEEEWKKLRDQVARETKK
jgi:hypothetical protein